jgi:hypothetical protein
MEKLVIDTEKKTAPFKVNIHVQLKEDVKDILEFVFMLDLAGSCDQVKAVVQFADTAKLNDIVARIKGNRGCSTVRLGSLEPIWQG